MKEVLKIGQLNTIEPKDQLFTEPTTK